MLLGNSSWRSDKAIFERIGASSGGTFIASRGAAMLEAHQRMYASVVTQQDRLPQSAAGHSEMEGRVLDANV